MTLALKDLPALRKSFEDTLVIYLNEPDTTKHDELIKKLDPKRQDEIQFIRTLYSELAKLEQQNRQQTKKPNVSHHAKIVYGAYLMILQDLENNLGYGEKKERSILWQRLNSDMGITDTEQLTAQQKANYQNAFNDFFKLIFRNNDSRQGLRGAEGFAFTCIPAPKLITFAKIGYELEKEAFITANKELTLQDETGTSKTLPIPFKSSINAPSSQVKELAAQFTPLITMKKQLHTIRLLEIADKGVGTKEKLLEQYPERARQLIFLKRLAKHLISASMAEHEKKIVLVGAIYMIRDQIGLTYSKKPASRDEISSTVVHCELSNMLGIKEENFDENIALYVNETRAYLRHLTMEEKREPKQPIKYVIKKEHLFSTIEGFLIPTLLNIIAKMIHACHINALERCLNPIEKSPSHEAGSSSQHASSSSYSQAASSSSYSQAASSSGTWSYVSSFFSGKSKSKPKPVELRPEREERPDPNGHESLPPHLPSPSR